MSEANDKERQRFETWITGQPILLRLDRQAVQLAWAAWQAAVAGSVRFAEPVPMAVRMIELEDVDEAT